MTYHARNREHEIDRVRVRQTKTSLSSGSCATLHRVDCGLTFAAHQMDFDHRDPRLVVPIDRGQGHVSKSRCGAPRSKLTSVMSSVPIAIACGHTETAVVASGPGRPISVSRPQARRVVVRSILLDRLRDVPCTDCGRRFPPYGMDFDHRDPTAKQYTVSRMIGRAGTARILDEVSKCDIVCANCHRARTYDRRMTARVRE